MKMIHRISINYPSCSHFSRFFPGRTDRNPRAPASNLVLFLPSLLTYLGGSYTGGSSQLEVGNFAWWGFEVVPKESSRRYLGTCYLSIKERWKDATFEKPCPVLSAVSAVITSFYVSLHLRVFLFYLGNFSIIFFYHVLEEMLLKGEGFLEQM